MYDDTILLDFIKKYNLDFDEISSFDNNYFKIKKTSIFEIFQSSILSYLEVDSSNKESMIKLKLEELFFNILESDSKEYFKIFLSSICNQYFFKIKIEKEFMYDKNINHLYDKYQLFFILGGFFFVIIILLLFWLFYRLLYGILMRRLEKNYNELKKIDY